MRVLYGIPTTIKQSCARFILVALFSVTLIVYAPCATAEDGAVDSAAEVAEDAETASSGGPSRYSDWGAKTLDLCVVRPLSAVSTVIGFGFFVVSTPFVAPAWDFSTTWDYFVAEPADATFFRPLGELD